MIEWNKCYYTDCLDKNNGLPYLEKLIENGEMDKIDLCLTDPPYNINAGITEGLCSSHKRHKRDNTVKTYNDNIENYREWCYSWFELLKKICNKIIFTCGKLNLKMWFEEYDFHLVIWLIRNSSSRGFVSKFVRHEPILCFGDFKKRKLTFDVIDAIARGGFLGTVNFVHPHPKPQKLFKDIISQLQPKTVIDPFLGSGTTAEVCTKLGIKWIGYEINTEYEEDINNRLKKCKKEPIQTNLFSYKNFELKV